MAQSAAERTRCTFCQRFIRPARDMDDWLREETEYAHESFIGDECDCDQGDTGFGIMAREDSPEARLSAKALAALKRPGPTPGAQPSRMRRYLCSGCSPARGARAAGSDVRLVCGHCQTDMIHMPTASEQAFANGTA